MCDKRGNLPPGTVVECVPPAICSRIGPLNLS